MMQNPYLVVPTNSNVKLTGEIAKLFGSTEQLKEKLTFLDWNAINPKRGDWADRFNREVKI
jgi:putative spermidine/putrescine transport system substrate-binding protein